MSEPASPDRCHCATCADEGVPMVVLLLDEDRGLALCSRDDGTRVTVEATLVGPVAAGDVLIVHAGTAIAALSASERQELPA